MTGYSKVSRPNIKNILSRTEPLNWLLFFAIHFSFLFLFLFWHFLPVFAIIMIGSLLTAWHSSMQHEFLHGHPTKNIKINNALASVPFMVWLPYGIFRLTHLRHHRKEKITCPLEDPETQYVTPENWDNLRPWQQKTLLFNKTFLGRMLIGPALCIFVFFKSEFLAGKNKNRKHAKFWRQHFISLGLFFGFLMIMGINPLIYTALIIYPATSLILVRSFAEHKAADHPDERCAIIESNWFWQLLFLNNNFHAIHHEHPHLPWYKIPGKYAALKASLRTEGRVYFIDGYADIIRNYFLTPWDKLVRKQDLKPTPPPQ